MSIYNHIFDKIYDHSMECPFCNKTFNYWTEEQVPGFRMKDELICPYCKKEIKSSMQVEYHVEKPTE